MAARAWLSPPMAWQSWGAGPSQGFPGRKQQQQGVGASPRVQVQVQGAVPAENDPFPSSPSSCQELQDTAFWQQQAHLGWERGSVGAPELRGVESSPRLPKFTYFPKDLLSPSPLSLHHCHHCCHTPWVESSLHIPTPCCANSKIQKSLGRLFLPEPSMAIRIPATRTHAHTQTRIVALEIFFQEAPDWQGSLSPGPQAHTLIHP